MTLTAFALVAVTVLVSAFVQGATGMGFAMIAAPVIGLMEPQLIPVLLLVLMVPLNGWVAFRERASLDWRGVGWIGVGRFAGTFAGLWILVLLSENHLMLLVGAATLVAALAALLAPAFDPTRVGLAVVGVITGVTETSTGVGGPPLAMAYQHKPGPVLRSTVAMCFLIGEVISLVVLGISGELGSDALALSAALLPFVLLGALLSTLAPPPRRPPPALSGTRVRGRLRRGAPGPGLSICSRDRLTCQLRVPPTRPARPRGCTA